MVAAPITASPYAQHALERVRKVGVYNLVRLQPIPWRLIDALYCAEVRLSRREEQVLAAYCDGLRLHEVADELGLAPETVRTYEQSARLRLDARTLEQGCAVYAGAWALLLAGQDEARRS